MHAKITFPFSLSPPPTHILLPSFFLWWCGVRAKSPWAFALLSEIPLLAYSPREVINFQDLAGNSYETGRHGRPITCRGRPFHGRTLAKASTRAAGVAAAILKRGPRPMTARCLVAAAALAALQPSPRPGGRFSANVSRIIGHVSPGQPIEAGLV